MNRVFVGVRVRCVVDHVDARQRGGGTAIAVADRVGETGGAREARSRREGEAAVRRAAERALQPCRVGGADPQGVTIGVTVVGQQAGRAQRQRPIAARAEMVVARHRRGIGDVNHGIRRVRTAESIADRVAERRVAGKARVGREGEAAVRAWVADHALARQAGDVEDRHTQGIAVRILVVSQQARRGHRQCAAGMNGVFVGVRVRCAVTHIDVDRPRGDAAMTVADVVLESRCSDEAGGRRETEVPVRKRRQ